MIKLETAKMTKAIERAKAIRPRVRVISADKRIYSVWRRERHVETAYTVRFAVAGGLKLAECDCKAGVRGQMCYHIAAAAQVNVMTQSMRRQAASAPASLASRITRRIERGHSGAKVVAVYCDGWAI